MATVGKIRGQLAASISSPGRGPCIRLIVQKVARKLRNVLKRLLHAYRTGLASVAYRVPERVNLVFLINNAVLFGLPLAHDVDWASCGL
jgi:hypothetical protein